MSFTDVVGRGGDTTKTPTPKTNKPSSGILKNINDRLVQGGYTLNVDLTTEEALSQLTNAQKKTIAAILDKAGFGVRSLAEVDAVISTAFPNLVWRDFPDLLGQIREQVIMGEGKEPKPDLARSVVKYDEAVLKEVAQSIALNKIGQTLSEEELQGAIDLANSMIEKGTVTKVKNVRNPKTGKLEQITETTPGFSEERFNVQLGQQLEEANPLLAERRKAFEFVDEMSKILSGGM